MSPPATLALPGPSHDPQWEQQHLQPCPWSGLGSLGGTQESLVGCRDPRRMQGLPAGSRDPIGMQRLPAGCREPGGMQGPPWDAGTTMGCRDFSWMQGFQQDAGPHRDAGTPLECRDHNGMQGFQLDAGSHRDAGTLTGLPQVPLSCVEVDCCGCSQLPCAAPALAALPLPSQPFLLN